MVFLRCRSSILLLILLGFAAFVVNGQQVQNVSQAITAQGYPCEVHTVETTDGFILTTIRIPHGIAGNTSNSARPVVFLQHGLLDSADTWVVNSPSESLAFILADAGFDVWLGNVRGNTYSSVNTKYSGVDLWTLVDFDNMIAIDLPTMVDLALNTSGAKSLAYVGHSQGTLMGFGGFSSMPDLAAKINIFMALAPVAYVGNVNSILLDFLADIDLAEWFAFFGEEEFMPSDEIIKILAGTLCVDVPEACSSIIFLLCGYDPSDLNETRVHVYMDDAPAGTSVRNMMHWSQAVASGKFQKFDYGTVGNMANYGQATPPQYYLEQLTGCPIALFTGTLDILADPADVNILEKKLPASNQPVLEINEPEYDHLDFVWGMDAHIKIYPYVVQLAQKYAPSS